MTAAEIARPAHVVLRRAPARRSIRRWRATLAGGAVLDLPERAVARRLAGERRHSCSSRATCSTATGCRPVNKLQYHSFWLRDTAIIAQALDLAGLHDPAREDLEYFGDLAAATTACSSRVPGSSTGSARRCGGWGSTCASAATRRSPPRSCPPWSGRWRGCSGARAEDPLQPRPAVGPPRQRAGRRTPGGRRLLGGGRPRRRGRRSPTRPDATTWPPRGAPSATTCARRRRAAAQARRARCRPRSTPPAGTTGATSGRPGPTRCSRRATGR